MNKWQSPALPCKRIFDAAAADLDWRVPSINSRRQRCRVLSLLELTTPFTTGSVWHKVIKTWPHIHYLWELMNCCSVRPSAGSSGCNAICSTQQINIGTRNLAEQSKYILLLLDLSPKQLHFSIFAPSSELLQCHEWWCTIWMCWFILLDLNSYYYWSLDAKSYYYVTHDLTWLDKKGPWREAILWKKISFCLVFLLFGLDPPPLFFGLIWGTLKTWFYTN